MNTSQVRLQDLFTYANGWLRWKSDAKTSARGKLAGCYNGDGRKYIRVDGNLQRASRLIYIFHFGEIPKDCVIDHINGDVKDDRIENLRIASQAENTLNTKRRSSLTGVTGVYYDSRDKVFYARGPKNKHLGRFKTIEEAQKARISHMQTYYKEYSNGY